MESLLKTDLFTGFRQIFYLVTPNETSFEKLEDVPKYIENSSLFFFMLIGLEVIVAAFHPDKLYRLADSISSMHAGMLMVLISPFFKGFDFVVFSWIYENYPSFNIQWNSTWSWVIGFIGTDIGYYWFHRLAHEVNFMWAAHQVHHSSEEYNLSTALRQSILQRLTSWMFYIPLAPFISASTLMVHNAFNTLYQFWIHTRVIKTLGPLEYIFNTQSHHRVHHGRNRYCIDKNYAGTLIIWDRMFGTFEAENDTVVYGLVHPLQTWDPIHVQFCHLQWMWKRFWEVEGLGNKLSVIFKGPGWEPGKPRLGLHEDLPDIKHPQPKYNTAIPVASQLYIMVHFVLNFFCYHFFMESLNDGGLTPLGALLGSMYLVYCLTCVGAICDLNPYVPLMEGIRCLTVLAATTFMERELIDITHFDGAVFLAVRIIYLLSGFCWLSQVTQAFRQKQKTN